MLLLRESLSCDTITRLLARITTKPLLLLTSLIVCLHASQVARLNKESMSNRDYFRAWDKFDVEKQIEDLDAEDEEEKIKAKEAREGARAREEKSRARREREMEELRGKMKFNDLTEKERKWMSQREKVRRSESKCDELISMFGIQ